MSSWGSYPSIFAMGHKAIQDLLNHDVNVEEKVDGSQFSFGNLAVDLTDNVYSPDINGRALRVRSKGAVMHPDAPEALFKRCVATVNRLNTEGLLHPEWTYRAEAINSPKHNALTYDRVPLGNLIIFDINTGNQEFLSYEDKAAEAARLGLEVVPRLFRGRIESISAFRSFLDTTSILGGQKIEGVVVKPNAYDLFGQDKKVLMGKFVSEAFKEVHRKTWGESNPSNKDIVGLIGQTFTTPARWNKAVLHLREAGLIRDVVQDIGLIIREVPEDVFKECEEEMKEMLWKHAKPHIKRSLTHGLPMWYKDQLLKLQFENEEAPTIVEEPK